MRLGSRAIEGYGLVVVLVLVAMTSLGLAAASDVWLQTSKRDKEQELLRIGQLYAQALTRYRDLSPGSAKRLPQELTELLQDQRFVTTMRHLRQLYPDPVARDGRWAVLRGDDGRITGVYSLSEDEPLAAGGVHRVGLELPPAARYSDWKFVAEPKK